MKTGKKSWREKLEGVHDWKIVDGGPRSPGLLLVPTPKQVDAIIREIPPGAVSSVKLIRRALARRLGAESTCPLCTGIFIRIAAEVADEERASGNEWVTPYWRVVDGRGKHMPKLPGGREGQASLLQAEVDAALSR
ncbi:MAG: MGMT family protein [Fimbriimonas sp.]|nr:MGMT family protein [Fimbriimonas sp.]